MEDAEDGMLLCLWKMKEEGKDKVDKIFHAWLFIVIVISLYNFLFLGSNKLM